VGTRVSVNGRHGPRGTVGGQAARSRRAGIITEQKYWLNQKLRRARCRTPYTAGQDVQVRSKGMGVPDCSSWVSFPTDASILANLVKN
jgi:hypothetical protein